MPNSALFKIIFVINKQGLIFAVHNHNHLKHERMRIYRHNHGKGYFNVPIKKEEIAGINLETGNNSCWAIITGEYPNRTRRRAMSLEPQHAHNNRKVTSGRITSRMLKGLLVLPKKFMAYVSDKLNSIKLFTSGKFARN